MSEAHVSLFSNYLFTSSVISKHSKIIHIDFPYAKSDFDAMNVHVTTLGHLTDVRCKTSIHQTVQDI